MEGEEEAWVEGIMDEVGRAYINKSDLCGPEGWKVRRCAILWYIRAMTGYNMTLTVRCGIMTEGTLEDVS